MKHIILLLLVIFILWIIFIEFKECFEENLYFDENLLNNENRLDYYINGNVDEKIIDSSKLNLDGSHHLVNNDFFIKKNKVVGNYYDEMFNYYYSVLKTNKNIYYISGDVQHSGDFPAITKTRPIGINNNIILKLNIKRHWGGLNDVKEHDIEYDLKDNKIIWRGVNAGQGERVEFVNKYYDHNNKNIDVSFIDDGIKETEHLRKDSMSIKEMLKSKFLVSIKGNDVATNLKWIIYSNSLCFMPKKQVHVSWFMEDKLVPWYHYVPLNDDYSDLEERYNWCLKNPMKCKEIVRNASAYVKPFLDIENEEYLNKKVLEHYIKTITIT
jgi:hypothetical protein